MITRTFNRTTYLIKGINNADAIETFELELWEHEIPKSKRAMNALFNAECEKRGLELFKASVANVFSEIRGMNEAEFFKASVHVDR